MGTKDIMTIYTSIHDQPYTCSLIDMCSESHDEHELGVRMYTRVRSLDKGLDGIMEDVNRVRKRSRKAWSSRS